MVCLWARGCVATPVANERNIVEPPDHQIHIFLGFKEEGETRPGLETVTLLQNARQLKFKKAATCSHSRFFKSAMTRDVRVETEGIMKWNERLETKGRGKRRGGKFWNERKEVTNGTRKDGCNKMDELKGKEKQDEQERRVETKGRGKRTACKNWNEGRK